MELLSADVIDLQEAAEGREQGRVVSGLEELEALRLRQVQILLDARFACEQAEASGKDAGPGTAQSRLCEAVRALEEVDDLLFSVRLDRSAPLAG
ncbi:hypothetical protein E2F48_09765 [Arthrobacter crusticola]|uniref:Uncharacterized protein n=1 Tax=Arthrobacter crusticola TaxID=2547960 RepID=A0A4R5TWK0_9MICC|nr:hypothetical protein [Arthrobacter crusticola]TDK25527.1 hypothetical protein E2F48_09765 [Arthrobacter crusticola]